MSTKADKSGVKQEEKPAEVMKLTKPIKNFDEELTELKFRELTGGDCRRCGVPFDFKDGSFSMDEQKLAH